MMEYSVVRVAGVILPIVSDKVWLLDVFFSMFAEW